MKWRPCWCPKPVLWELNSFLMPTLSFVPINLHTGHVGENALYATSTFAIMHLICTPPPPPTHPPIMHNLSFLLGITAVPREIKNNAFKKTFFLGGGAAGGQIRCVIRKVEVAYRRIALAVATVGP